MRKQKLDCVELSDDHMSSGVWEVSSRSDAETASFALHDACNLLNVLGATLDWLMSERQADPAETQIALADARDAYLRLEALVRGALSEACARTIAHAVDGRWVRPAEIIAAVATRARMRARQRKIHCRISADEGVARLDPVLITRALENLLDNALKASRDGGNIELFAEHRGGEWILGVRDDGVGVPVDQREAIFEMFHSGPGASGGLGLGLAFCRRVARAHGGSISVESEPGCGASFVMRIPLPATHAR